MTLLRLTRARRLAGALACGALLTATTATTAGAATNPLYPRSCGAAKPGSFFDVFVTRNTTCGYGRSVYRAVIAEQDRRGGFVSAVSSSFRLKLTTGGRTVTLDCRAIARAHGVHDFTCNRGKGAARVGVLLDDRS